MLQIYEKLHYLEKFFLLSYFYSSCDGVSKHAMRHKSNKTSFFGSLNYTLWFALKSGMCGLVVYRLSMY